MIIGKDRPEVIENIRRAATAEDFYAKVEIDDPVLTDAQCKAITQAHIRRRGTASYKLKAFAARRIANIATGLLNRNTCIVMDTNKPIPNEGMLITSNHFSPIENTVVRHFVRKQGYRRLNVVCQVTNLAMNGPIGFLMNYADTVPLLQEPHYMNREFLDILKALTDKGEAVLIYPEQEMWLNYRKPRPPKRGAYYFAAKLQIPVVCCFVEMVDEPEMDTEEFHKVKFILHILDVLYPDPAKSVKDNSTAMCRQDYALKKAAYEKAYGKPLDYTFDPTDIAGWVGGCHG